jgi:hypothetical protein
LQGDLAGCNAGARWDAPDAGVGLARRMQCPRRMDFIALSIALGFFAASWGFVALCERLRS